MEKIQKKKKYRFKIYGISIIIILFLSLGFILGMTYEQRLIYVSFGEALSYTNIEFNINETKLVDRVTENMKPIIWDIRMQNCTRTEKDYCALECYENNKLIPCQNFTNDEHFCDNGILSNFLYCNCFDIYPCNIFNC